MASAAFQDLFARHAMASYAKQLTLADTTPGTTWDADLARGTLTFGSDLSLPVGLLGSYAERSRTWLWSWGNAAIAEGLGPHVLDAAKQMRALGESQNIPELRDAKFEADENLCYRLAVVTVGVTGAGAHYRGPYDGGAAYMVLRNPLPRPPHRHDLARVQRVIAESISTFELPHRQALKAYFETEGMDVEETEPTEIVAMANDGDLRVRFDGNGRITEMKSLLRAATKPKGSFFNRLFRKD